MKSFFTDANSRRVKTPAGLDTPQRRELRKENFTDFEMELLQAGHGSRDWALPSAALAH
jgi:hypothetical protein